MSHMRTVARALHSARGRMVHKETLLDRMYGDRADGGPDDPENTLGVTICRLRKVFGKDTIRTFWGEGYAWNIQVQPPVEWTAEVV